MHNQITLVFIIDLFIDPVSTGNIGHIYQDSS